MQIWYHYLSTLGYPVKSKCTGKTVKRDKKCMPWWINKDDTPLNKLRKRHSTITFRLLYFLFNEYSWHCYGAKIIGFMRDVLNPSTGKTRCGRPDFAFLPWHLVRTVRHQNSRHDIQHTLNVMFKMHWRLNMNLLFKLINGIGIKRQSVCTPWIWINDDRYHISGTKITLCTKIMFKV